MDSLFKKCQRKKFPWILNSKNAKDKNLNEIWFKKCQRKKSPWNLYPKNVFGRNLLEILCF
jgi:hypothetical protein